MADPVLVLEPVPVELIEAVTVSEIVQEGVCELVPVRVLVGEIDGDTDDVEVVVKVEDAVFVGVVGGLKELVELAVPEIVCVTVPETDRTKEEVADLVFERVPDRVGVSEFVRVKVPEFV